MSDADKLFAEKEWWKGQAVFYSEQFSRMVKLHEELTSAYRDLQKQCEESILRRRS